MPNAFFLCIVAVGEPPDPPLSDLERFPPEAIVRNQLDMNEAFQDYLKGRLEVAFHQREALGDHLCRAAFVWDCWDGLHDAQCSYYSEGFRRRRLADVRRRIGTPAYQLGLMPPGVPAWKFPEID